MLSKILVACKQPFSDNSGMALKSLSLVNEVKPASSLIAGYSVQQRPIELHPFILSQECLFSLPGFAADAVNEIHLAALKNMMEASLTKEPKKNFRVILLGGVHGDEPEGYLLAEQLLRSLQQFKQREVVNSPSHSSDQNGTAGKLQLWLCPRLNPDGCSFNRRTNHHNVDLNRNLPTQDWQDDFENVRYYPGPYAGSEAETKLTLAMIETYQPHLIISLHSFSDAMVNYNGPCEPVAQILSALNRLPAKSDIGYPTPGSLGTYLGVERKIPVITLEILRGQTSTEVWQQQAPALNALFSSMLKILS